MISGEPSSLLYIFWNLSLISMRTLKLAYEFSLYGLDPSLLKEYSTKPSDFLKGYGFSSAFTKKDENLMEELRDAGISVYVEVPLFVGELLWKKFPRSRPITEEGEPLEKVEWYAGVNPSVPEVRKFCSEKVRRAAKLPVNGVWLDFIRWPCRWESPSPRLVQTSFDDLTIELFSRDTGIEVPQINPKERASFIIKNYLEEWTDWKCRQITSFVSEARKILGSDKKLGMFLVPWKSEDYNGAIRSIIGQDVEELKEYVDVFSPMVYHAMCGKPVEWISDVTSWVWKKTGKEVLPIIQVADVPRRLSDEEIELALEAAISVRGSKGVIIFSMRHLNEKKLEVIARKIRQLG